MEGFVVEADRKERRQSIHDLPQVAVAASQCVHSPQINSFGYRSLIHPDVCGVAVLGHRVAIQVCQAQSPSGPVILETAPQHPDAVGHKAALMDRPRSLNIHVLRNENECARLGESTLRAVPAIDQPWFLISE